MPGREGRPSGVGLTVVPHLGLSDQRSRGGSITRKRHDEPHAPLGHKEKARGWRTWQPTASRRPSKRGTNGARATPSVAAAVLPHVNGAARPAHYTP